MDRKEYYDQCEKCGRRFPAPAPSCPCSTGFVEYRYKAKGCIRNKDPECPYNAVIASVTIPTSDGIANLADCFVHVENINTTYYIDDKHRIMKIWAGPVELDEYDIEANPLKLRGQTCYTIINGDYVEVFFDRQGVGHIMGTEV